MPNEYAFAFDRESARTFDKDGHLHVPQNIISKAEISPYIGHEIPGYEKLGLDPNRVYKMLRDPKELAKSVKSFEGKPLIFKHIPVSAEDHPFDEVVGAIANATYDHPHLKADLHFWPSKAIDAIKSGKLSSLSGGYAYEPDMTPGTYEGERFDGSMKNIRGNHLSMVSEGRIKDAVVADHALEAEGQSGMTDRNTAGKAKFAADALKLAQDGKFDELREFLEAFSAEGAPGGEEMDAEPPALGGPPEAEAAAPGAPPAAGEGEAPPEGGDPIEAVKKFLMSKGLNDADMAELDKLVAKIGEAGAQHEEAEEEGKPPVAAEGQPDKPAVPPKPTEDEDPDNQENNDMVTKPAMDAAIASAVQRERQANKELREALDFVRPHVGALAMSFDSAEGVLKAAAKSLKVPDADKIRDPVALRALITMAGAKPARAPVALVAMDAAANDEFAKRFPNAGRLK